MAAIAVVEAQEIGSVEREVKSKVAPLHAST
jgi:hypothetical protein